jgi:hypothetical protein
MTLLPIVAQDILPPAPATQQHAPNTHRQAIIPKGKMATPPELRRTTPQKPSIDRLACFFVSRRPSHILSAPVWRPHKKRSEIP